MKEIIDAPWWNNPLETSAFIKWLFSIKKISTVEELFDVQDHPEKYNKEYIAFLEEKEKRYTFEKKRTQEFFDERFYPINGEMYKSLTTVLWAYPSPWLTKLIGEAGATEVELRKKIKGERGSRVHDALQRNAIVRREDFDDEEWLSLIHAQEFLDEYKPKMILNEEWCWSVKHKIATRLDRIVEIDGKVTLIDWKTGFVGDEAWLQLAGTKLCAEETFPLTIQRWGIVALNAQVKKGWKFMPIDERPDVQDELLAFKNMDKKDPKEILEMVIKNAFERDIHVIHALHEVWKHAFRNVRPKRYPREVVPDELKLAIESVEKRFDLIEKIKQAHVEAKTLPEVPVKPEEEKGKAADLPVNPNTQENLIEPAKTAVEPATKDGAPSPAKDLPLPELIAEVRSVPYSKIDKWIEKNHKRMMALPIPDLQKLQIEIRTIKLEHKGEGHAKRNKE